MSETVVVSAAAATAAAVDILTARGVSPADAAIVARNLVAADVRGIDTHGLVCLREYADCVADRRINPQPKMTVTRRMPWAT